MSEIYEGSNAYIVLMRKRYSYICAVTVDPVCRAPSFGKEDPDSRLAWQNTSMYANGT